MNYIKISNDKEYQNKKKEILKIKKPTVIEVFTSPEQESLFKQGYKDNNDGTFSPMNLNEMYPFIPNPIANTNN